jgi:hypothetical protein
MEYVFKALGRATPKWWNNRFIAGTKFSLLCNLILDWIFPIVLLGITYFITNATGPFHRYLPVDDDTVAYPIRPDTVPGEFSKFYQN